MKKQRFTEERIIGVLREQEAGAKVADLCRKHGISEATFYNWKAKYGGMEVYEAKRLKVTCRRYRPFAHRHERSDAGGRQGGDRRSR